MKPVAPPITTDMLRRKGTSERSIMSTSKADSEASCNMTMMSTEAEEKNANVKMNQEVTDSTRQQGISPCLPPLPNAPKIKRTEEESISHERRLEQNRKTAKLRRDRYRQYLDDLQIKETELKYQNECLKRGNEAMKDLCSRLISILNAPSNNTNVAAMNGGNSNDLSMSNQLFSAFPLLPNNINYLAVNPSLMMSTLTSKLTEEQDETNSNQVSQSSSSSFNPNLQQIQSFTSPFANLTPPVPSQEEINTQHRLASLILTAQQIYQQDHINARAASSSSLVTGGFPPRDGDLVTSQISHDSVSPHRSSQTSYDSMAGGANGINGRLSMSVGNQQALTDSNLVGRQGMSSSLQPFPHSGPAWAVTLPPKKKKRTSSSSVHSQDE